MRILFFSIFCFFLRSAIGSEGPSIRWDPKGEVQTIEVLVREGLDVPYRSVFRANSTSLNFKYVGGKEGHEVLALAYGASGDVFDASWIKLDNFYEPKTIVLGSALVLGPERGAFNDVARVKRFLALAKSSNKVALFKAGEYVVDGKSGVEVPSNVSIVFSEGATFRFKETDSGAYQMLGISDANDVRIFGGHLVGDRDGHLGVGGEWGMCLKIMRSVRVYVHGLRANSCWGDGVYIGFDGSPNQDVWLESVNASGNRRNGVSIVGGDRVVVNGGDFDRNGGVKPGAGIDVEPNRKSDIVNSIYLRAVNTANNVGAGVQVGLGKLREGSRPFLVSVNSHRDSQSGVGLLLSNSAAKGLVEVSGGEWAGAGRRVEIRGRFGDRWIKYLPRGGNVSPSLKMFQ